MDKKLLTAVVEPVRTGLPQVEASALGLFPIYWERRKIFIGDYFEGFLDLSRKFWTYRKFTGFGIPWHDQEDPRKIYNFHKSSIVGCLQFLEDHDIHWKTFLVLALCMSDYRDYDRPSLLLGNAAFRNRFVNLRKYVGSRQRMDDIAFFMLELIRLQIEKFGYAKLPKSQGFLVREAGGGSKTGKPPFVLGLYRKVSDRIGQIEQHGADYVDWMRAKVDNFFGRLEVPEFGIGIILNQNSYDPDFKTLRSQVSDPWRGVKKFLKLPANCEMRDGSIPKGWLPAVEDQSEREKIVAITAEGYYYYSDGTQWRGKRHYASNKYLVIQCNPNNFLYFVGSWYDARLLTGKPTWEEYQKWGLYPNIWNEEGQNISEYHGIKPVVWRKP